ncbi:MAG: autophagy-related protein 17 [Bacilli bacterium]|jgi:hypothetical protein|nr:autophagy-related protein 17 [Bacilli bacterium]
MFGFKKKGQKRLRSFDIVYKADGRKQIQGFNEEDYKARRDFLADYHSALSQGCKVVHRKWTRKPYFRNNCR